MATVPWVTSTSGRGIGGHLVPPGRQREVARHGRQQRADEVHLRREVAARVLERGHGRLEVQVRRERLVEQPAGGTLHAQLVAHLVIGAIERAVERLVDQRVQRAIAQPAERAPAGASARARTAPCRRCAC